VSVNDTSFPHRRWTASRFESALVGLVTELWLTLERELIETQPDAQVRGLAILKIELDLLDAARRRLVGRGQITAAQSDRLEALANDLARLLGDDRSAPRERLWQLQDRLFDEAVALAGPASTVRAAG
jgi:hypothetical protein